MKLLKWLSAVAAFGVLMACGSGSDFEGKYEAVEGTQEFNFETDGYVTQSLMGNEVATYKFEKKGEEVKIQTNEKTAAVFTLQKNGELIGPMGVVLTPIGDGNQTDSISKTSNQHMIGTYVCDGRAMVHLEIISNDKGFLENRSEEDYPRQEFEYQTNDNEMTLTIGGESVVFTINGSDLVSGVSDVGSCPKS